MSDTKKKSTKVKEFFRDSTTRPKKSFGQNFLRDKNYVERIIEAADLGAGDTVLEIGPGLGALTTGLADRAKRVIALEKDIEVANELESVIKGSTNVELSVTDALEVDYTELLVPNKVKVVSNLPYSVATPILIRLLDVRELLGLLIVMVQKEVGERINAIPGTKAYGSLSVLFQVYTDVKTLFRVPSSAFWPRPKVDSVVLRITPLAQPRVDIQNRDLFERVVRAAFTSRRKMLVNSLGSVMTKDEAERVLDEAGIDKKRRGETLTIEEFGTLYRKAATYL